MKNINEKGFGIIEVLVASTISIVVLLGIASYLNYAMKVSAEGTKKVEALYHAKSLIEQSRAFRDEDWDVLWALTKDANYHFDQSATTPEKWVAVLGQGTFGEYTMQVVFSKVERDLNDDIVLTGGSGDDNTIKVTSTVTYSTRDGTGQVELFEYLTNH
ncbi:MAG: hypothetical protein KAI71_05285 [Candidatus Pacebacteria bacterium]|nr:hypothetical protein [Candidatus Paceibacterota bacterium]